MIYIGYDNLGYFIIIKYIKLKSCIINVHSNIMGHCRMVLSVLR